MVELKPNVLALDTYRADVNIFVLDDNPQKCAEYHCDKHVVKMSLETAQILCSVRHIHNDFRNIPYRKTHINHPCVKWAATAQDNYIWLCHLGLELCAEYKFRYSKTHKCLDVIQDCLSFSFSQTVGMTPFVLAMPDYCKLSDPIKAYRNYYLQEKRYMANWSKRPIPWWFN